MTVVSPESGQPSDVPTLEPATPDTTSAVSPGSVVLVRNEEWLVTKVEQSSDGQLVSVQGLSELVRGTTSVFSTALDMVTPLEPHNATLRADDSPGHRRSRLWLESTIRKTPVPSMSDQLTVSSRALARPLRYQQEAVRTALGPHTLRPRILLADAVGLGKTLEIGMILSELVRRGRGERMLIVCPRHVLEQMQQEMWCRFALPFVRLDSVGVQRVKQKLPANRNPFSYFHRVIVSMDTLKQDRFARDLRRHHWDAVVIDESHNVTNTAAQNNRLARILAPHCDALILASATPHNGNAQSFAEMVRLLEPTAVSADGELDQSRLQHLVVRRHRHSPEVASEVGEDWAERAEPRNRLVTASEAENAVAAELDQTWLHPADGSSPSASGNHLFAWILAKAFLSSPAALQATIDERLKRLDETTAARVEGEALHRLSVLNEACLAEPGGKYGALVEELRGIDVKGGNRAVVFSERRDTLSWLQRRLCRDLTLTDQQVQVLHGGLSDDAQQAIVESFRQATSPIRVLVTGDVASEGVNLHRQCHHLIHFDIPWSLIRIEQRNGRIDRFGQKHPPQITTLLLQPDSPGFAGDVRVLTSLMAKEHEAHGALGDAASLMGKYSVLAEENAVRAVLTRGGELDNILRSSDEVAELDPVAGFLAAMATQSASEERSHADAGLSLYASEVDYLREALHHLYPSPDAPPRDDGGGGVSWREDEHHGTVELVPPPDLRQRMEVLPRSYLKERDVTHRLTLATTTRRGNQAMADALSDESESSWPQAHFLGPLHPVLDWVADRSLAAVSRNEVLVVRGAVEVPTFLLVGTLTNRRGHTVATTWATAEHWGSMIITPRDNPAHAVNELRIADVNRGAVPRLDRWQGLVTKAVKAAEAQLAGTFRENERHVRERVEAWLHQSERWQAEADALLQRSSVRDRRSAVASQEALIADMVPDRSLVRPLMLVVPKDA